MLMLIHTQRKEFSYAIFRIFELHTHASDFSGSVKRDFATISHFNLHTFMTVLKIARL